MTKTQEVLARFEGVNVVHRSPMELRGIYWSSLLTLSLIVTV
jgi:hypothetical protein